MEANSEECRALRRRREIVENAEDEDNMEQSRQVENEESTPMNLPTEIEEPLDSESETSEVEFLEPDEQESWRNFSIKWSIYTLIWLTLYISFLKVRFGDVFLMFSFLIGIYLSTQTRPRRKGGVCV